VRDARRPSPRSARRCAERPRKRRAHQGWRGAGSRAQKLIAAERPPSRSDSVLDRPRRSPRRETAQGSLEVRTRKFLTSADAIAFCEATIPFGPRVGTDPPAPTSVTAAQPATSQSRLVRDGVDFDEETVARKSGDLNGGACRPMVAEHPLIDAVHAL